MYQVPAISQKTAAMCWEACGQMMWYWKHSGMNGYAARAGNYPKMNSGLKEKQMDSFYKQLGIRSLANPQGKNIRHALKRSPVIITDVGKQTGHAIVVVGWSGNQVQVANPCGIQTVNFDGTGGGSTVCSAAGHLLKAVNVENNLGNYIWYW